LNFGITTWAFFCLNPATLLIHMKKNFFLLILLAIFSAVPTAYAIECDADTDGCVAIGEWQVSVALGVGVRTNPVLDNDVIPLIVLPEISYNGERFFLQNLDMGFILIEDDVQQLNLLVTPSYDQVFFDRWDANNFILTASETLASPSFGPSAERLNLPVNTRQLRKRRMGGLAGFEYNRTLGSIDIQVHGLQEFTGFHQGQELHLAVAKSIRHGKHSMMFSAGANWQSSEVLNYYYGLEAGEGGSLDYQYQPGSGVSSVVRFDWNYHLNERWSLRLVTAYRLLSSEIKNSPLVTDDKVITAFAGGVYHF
jgi:outer membrane protein